MVLKLVSARGIRERPRPARAGPGRRRRVFVREDPAVRIPARIARLSRECIWRFTGNGGGAVQPHADASVGTRVAPRGWGSRIATSTAFRLAALAFVVYQINLRPVSSADTFPMRYAPISILTEGDLDFDEFVFLRSHPERTPGLEPGMPYYLQLRRGHYISTPPLMVAVLATPVYAIPVWLGLTGDASEVRAPGDGFTQTEVVGTLLSKIAASLLIAISVALVYLSLLHLVPASGARWITLVYAFSTSSWAVSSQGLWQTTGSQVLLAGTFLALLEAERRDSRALLALAGALVALAVMSRPTAIFFALLITLYVGQLHGRKLIAFLPAPIVLGALLVSYNLYYFGVLIGGYAAVTVENVYTWSQVAMGLEGLLVSPNRGLLTFSPVLIAAFVGGVMSFRKGNAVLLRYLAAGVVASLLYLSTMPQWHGQFSFSYRYLVESLPALALLATPTWQWLTARRWRLGVIGTLAGFSLFVQVVGAFYYPCDWYRSTRSDPAAMARFFDWSDLEVVQCLKAGPAESDGLRLIRGLVRRVAER